MPPSSIRRRSSSADELVPFTCDVLSHCSEFNAVLDLPEVEGDGGELHYYATVLQVGECQPRINISPVF